MRTKQFTYCNFSHFVSLDTDTLDTTFLDTNLTPSILMAYKKYEFMHDQ